jgi:hypothetical protein
MLVLAGLMTYDGYITGKLRRVNWPIFGCTACLLASPVWQVLASGHNSVSSIAYSMTSAGCDDDHHTRLEGRTRSTS